MQEFQNTIDQFESVLEEYDQVDEEVPYDIEQENPFETDLNRESAKEEG